MKTGIQNALKKLGDEGCYFICLLKAAEVKEDGIVGAYYECLKKKLIGDDCYVNDPVAILRLYGVEVSKVQKLGASEKLSLKQAPKVKIACYENGRYTHFVLMGNDGKIWDSLGNSNTVKKGSLKSWRLFF